MMQTHYGLGFQQQRDEFCLTVCARFAIDRLQLVANGIAAERAGLRESRQCAAVHHMRGKARFSRRERVCPCPHLLQFSNLAVDAFALSHFHHFVDDLDAG